MNPVRKTRLGLQMLHQAVGQPVQVGPEQLLAQVTTRAEGEAADQQIRQHGLQGPGVIHGEAAVVEEAADHLHPFHFRADRQTPGQLEHVGGLAAGIGITAEFQVLATEQAMELEMQNDQTQRSPRTAGTPLARSDTGGATRAARRPQQMRRAADGLQQADPGAVQAINGADPTPSAAPSAWWSHPSPAGA